MSTHKHIDLICVIAILLALALTVLFMNGAAFGLKAVNNDAATDGPFTANDLNGSWDTSKATRIVLTGEGGHVTGNGAYVDGGDVHIIYAGQYVLSGELTNGRVIIDADKQDKIWLLLDGVTLHCDDSAAIDIEQAAKVFLTLAEGSENTISTGSEYSDEAVEAGIDGAIYARDDVTINGTGSLTVDAQYKHAIVCNDDLVITGGKLNITAPQDGIHANDSVQIANADLTITAGDDGITVSNDDETAYFYMESGSLTIPACYEGIEAMDITIAGGVVDITPTDDGINANGREGGAAAIHITGGDIRIINPTGRDADGLDSNGSIEITGGHIFISVNTSSCALDCGTTCTISGGTVIAAGGSQMAEGFEEGSPQAFVMQNVSGQAGAQVTLAAADGAVMVSETIPCAFSNLVISTPELTLGDTVTLTVGDTETQITVDNSSTGGMGGFGGGMMGGRGGMGRRDWARTDADSSATPTGDAQVTSLAVSLAETDIPTPPEGASMPQGDRGQGGFGGRGGGMGRPDFGQMPADGQMPTPPDGMERPDFGGGQRPDRGEAPGGEAPADAPTDSAPAQEGETGIRPDFSGGQIPDGGEAPDSEDPADIPAGGENADVPQGQWTRPEGMMGGRGNRGGWAEDGQFPADQDAAQETVDEGFRPDATTIALVAASAVVLLAGLLIAFKFKR